MPAWLLSALGLLRTQGIALRTVAGPIARRAAGPLTAGTAGFQVAGAFDDPGDVVFGGGRPRRRRRRRALTASDRADIAFIAGVISKAEAGRFAVTLAAGLTR